MASAFRRKVQPVVLAQPCGLRSRHAQQGLGHAATVEQHTGTNGVPAAYVVDVGGELELLLAVVLYTPFYFSFGSQAEGFDVVR